jgi:hypothetical protein
MSIRIYSLFFIILVLAGCKKDFLEKLPLDDISDDTYWTNENNVRTFAWGFYPAYFEGYGSGFTAGRYYNGQALNDDFAPSNPVQFAKNAPTTGGGWTFTWVRKANLFIDRVQKVPMGEEAIKHWTGIGRFFRAMEYHDLVKRFGDVQWYDKELSETSSELYKPRDSRTLVVDNILADLKYASENVRLDDGNNGLAVNKYVVLAFMSRVMLYHGTYFKYHNLGAAKAQEYLEAAKWAAGEVINSGKYTITDNYRTVFNSLDLAGKKEVILYRRYETGLIMHSLHSNVNTEGQTGASKDAIESYLANDGLPIKISTKYKGDKTITDVMTDRDPRLKETFATEIRLSGGPKPPSSSGYVLHKFFNEAIKDLPEGKSNTNTTDAPIIRLGEVLLNYAEAAAELGTLTQVDVDKTINALRSRPGFTMAKLQVIGNEPAVNGTVYNDPERDPSVPSLIWEIRRERRVELMMEGFRLDDLKRWKKLDYADTQANSDINRGVWIRKVDYPDPTYKGVKIENDAAEGYVIPSPSTQRTIESKFYLDPLPLDQIKVFKDNGVTLTQNTGWE